MVREARIYRIQRIQTLANELINEYFIREQTLEDEKAGDYATTAKTIYDMCNELLRGEVADRKEWEVNKPKGRVAIAKRAETDGNALKRLARSHGVRLWEIAEKLECSDATLTRKLRGNVDIEFDKAFRQAIKDIITEDNQILANKEEEERENGNHVE